MSRHGTRLAGPSPARHRSEALPAPPHARADCLEQLLQAFCDIIDRDDIHQAAHRLALVQEWLRNEAQAAAADPIFADLPVG
ncbi:MAG TPA: hypothetical protein VJ770_23550 [Stellaceae bacterium]|nr:hypothetical protein [Stellaceae bacterium]